MISPESVTWSDRRFELCKYVMHACKRRRGARIFHASFSDLELFLPKQRM